MRPGRVCAQPARRTSVIEQQQWTGTAANTTSCSGRCSGNAGLRCRFVATANLVVFGACPQAPTSETRPGAHRAPELRRPGRASLINDRALAVLVALAASRTRAISGHRHAARSVLDEPCRARGELGERSARGARHV
jgi:hypothetical protein